MGTFRSGTISTIPSRASRHAHSLRDLSRRQLLRHHKRQRLRTSARVTPRIQILVVRIHAGQRVLGPFVDLTHESERSRRERSIRASFHKALTKRDEERERDSLRDLEMCVVPYGPNEARTVRWDSLLPRTLSLIE